MSRSASTPSPGFSHGFPEDRTIRRSICEGLQARASLRPACPGFENCDDFIAAVTALRAGGVADLAFCNYGHLRASSLEWIGAALGASS